MEEREGEGGRRGETQKSPSVRYPPRRRVWCCVFIDKSTLGDVSGLWQGVVSQRRRRREGGDECDGKPRNLGCRLNSPSLQSSCQTKKSERSCFTAARLWRGLRQSSWSSWLHSQPDKISGEKLVAQASDHQHEAKFQSRKEILIWFSRNTPAGERSRSWPTRLTNAVLGTSVGGGIIKRNYKMN